MKLNTYQKLAQKTAPQDHDGSAMRLARLSKLSHAAIGVVTEVGELLDAIKKHVYYNGPLDDINLQEELGDILWYVAEGCSALGVTMEDVAQRNIAKLKARFGDKFTEEGATIRNIEKEREILESKVVQASLPMDDMRQVCELCTRWVRFGETSGDCKIVGKTNQTDNCEHFRRKGI